MSLLNAKKDQRSRNKKRSTQRRLNSRFECIPFAGLSSLVKLEYHNYSRGCFPYPYRLDESELDHDCEEMLSYYLHLFSLQSSLRMQTPTRSSKLKFSNRGIGDPLPIFMMIQINPCLEGSVLCTFYEVNW